MSKINTRTQSIMIYKLSILINKLKNNSQFGIIDIHYSEIKGLSKLDIQLIESIMNTGVMTIEIEVIERWLNNVKLNLVETVGARIIMLYSNHLWKEYSK